MDYMDLKLLIYRLPTREDIILEYVQAGLALSMVFFVVVAIVGIYMRFANHIGETFGIGNFFMNLRRKAGKNK